MNTSQIINQIILKGSFPSDGFFSQDEFLMILNDVMRVDIVPLLIAFKEDFFVDTHTQTNVVNGRIKIPSRAIGSKIRAIYKGDVKLRRDFDYTIEKNVIILNSIPSPTEEIKIKYYCKPNDLVDVTQGSIVQSVSGNDVVVDSISGSLAASLIDVVEGRNSFEIIKKDQTIVGISGTTITLSDTTDIVPGDVITIAGKSIYPNLPEELQHLLIQGALVQCLTAKKDQSAQLEMQKYELMKQNITNLMDDRQDEPSPIRLSLSVKSRLSR